MTYYESALCTLTGYGTLRGTLSEGEAPRARTHIRHSTHSFLALESRVLAFTFIVLAFYFCPTESQTNQDAAPGSVRLYWLVCGRAQRNGAAPPGARALLHVHTCRHRDHRWSCETCVLPNAFTRREWQSLGARTERVKLYDSSTVWGGAGGGRAGMRGSCANSLTLTPTDQLMSHEPRTGHERLLVYRVIYVSSS